MYITSLSVDNFKLYLTVSFSRTSMVLHLNYKTRQLKNAQIGWPTLLYGYETSF